MNRTICSTALLLAAVGSSAVCLGQEHRLAVLSDGYYVYVHQAGGARINTMRVSEAQDVAMNRDGSRMAVLANDYYVKLFDGGGQLLNTLRVNKARDVAVSGDYAFVADGPAGLCMVNVADPAAPTEATCLDTEGEAQGVALDGDYVYVADGVEGLRVVHVVDPVTLVEVGSAPSTAPAIVLRDTFMDPSP